MISVVLLLGMLSGQRVVVPPNSGPTVSICQIADDPARFDGKVVRIAAIDSFRGNQQFGLSDEGCKGTKLWLELPEKYRGQEQFEKMFRFFPSQTAYVHGVYVGKFSLRPSDVHQMVVTISEIKTGSYVTN